VHLSLFETLNWASFFIKMIFNALPLLATATLFSSVRVSVSAGGASGEPNGGSMVVERFGELDILNGGSGSLVAREASDSEDLWHSPANNTCRVEAQFTSPFWLHR
jgi:hypothetical protein